VVYGSGSQQFQSPFFPLIAKNAHVRFFIAYHLSVVQRDRAIALLHDLLVSGTLKHSIAAGFPLGEIARASLYGGGWQGCYCPEMQKSTAM
jgi:hypothetical protein